jgi:hypothetical protein
MPNAEQLDAGQIVETPYLSRLDGNLQNSRGARGFATLDPT